LSRYFSELNLGVKYMLISSICSAFVAAFAKELSTHMDSLEVVFFRNVIGVLLVGVTFLKFPVKQVGGKPFLLFFRGFIGFVSLVAYFYNIANISLADATTFSKTAPIFTAIFAYMFLKEELGLKAFIAIVIGFIGIVFIIKPNGLRLDLTDLLGIFSGAGAALAYTSVRELKKYYDTRMIVLSFMGIGTIGPILLIMFNDYIAIEGFEFLKASFIVPDMTMWFLIFGLGISATGTQTYLTKAYGATKAGIVGAVSYSTILFSMMLGIMLGDSLPDVIGTLGIILIIIGGILVAKEKK